MIGRRKLLLAAASAVACKPALAAPPATFRVALVGDCLFASDLVKNDPGFSKLALLLARADLTIGNFEGTLADDGSWGIEINPQGKPRCGGMNVRGEESVPGDLAALGFDMMGTANNHAWDWGPDGVLATVRKLSAAGLNPAGTGADLPAARKASFHEVKGVTVALVSCASTYWPGTLASMPNAEVPGRPGVNPLRYATQGEGRGAPTTADPRDVQAITEVIRDARTKADVVIVSCHTHEQSGDRLTPPDFQKAFAYACVEAGAGAFFSHGPHVLRGIEVRAGVPILYGLGGFIYRVRDRRPLPADLFESCGIESRDSGAYFEYRLTAEPSYKDSDFWEAVVAELDFRDGRLSGLTLTPTIIQRDPAESWGMPALADPATAQAILERMQRMSKPFGAEIAIKNGIGALRLPHSR
jgi:poly-gamma-glutamate synthesis protein (capsule biosynthesis protein)